MVAGWRVDHGIGAWCHGQVPWTGAMVAECLRSEVALLGKLSGQVFRKEELWESIDTVANPTMG